MGYYEDAKHTCPLCRSTMAEAIDPWGESFCFHDSYGCQWDAYRCANAECGVIWSYGDILESKDPYDHVRVVEIDTKLRGEKSDKAGLTLHVEWSQNAAWPSGKVEATLTREAQRFRKRPIPVHVSVQAASLASGDRDKALREAFSVWRLRNIT